MKKFKLHISIRHGMEHHPLGDIILNTETWEDFERIGKLDVFKKDSYLVFSLEELPIEEDLEDKD